MLTYQCPRLPLLAQVDCFRIAGQFPSSPQFLGPELMRVRMTELTSLNVVAIIAATLGNTAPATRANSPPISA
jgi:hypothetical protein